MLDPIWTPERGYSHALDLLRIVEQAEERRRLEQEQEEQRIDGWADVPDAGLPAAYAAARGPAMLAG